MASNSLADRSQGFQTGTPGPTLAAFVIQVGGIAALVWLWSTGESDSSATTVDWWYVGLTAATPIALAISAMVGWMLRRGSGKVRLRPLPVLAVLTHWVTIALVGPAMCLAPVIILTAVVVGPIG